MKGILILSMILAALMTALPGGAFAQAPPDGPCCPDDEMSNVEYVLLAPGLLLMGTNIVLAAHNSSALASGEPSGLGGGGGIIVGALGTAYGVLLIAYEDEEALRFTGIGCAAAGAISLYYGAVSTRASNRKYDEEHGMVLDPVLIEDGAGSLVPGIQLSWSF